MSERQDAISFADSMARLRSAQKSSAGAPIYSVLINRPMGRVCAALAHQAGLVPNQVTMISALFTGTAIVLIMILPPGWVAAVSVTAALMIGYVLDASDGQLARLRGGGSLAGEWLDHVIDAGKVATMHLAVLVMASRYFDVPTWWLVVPMAFSAACVVHFAGFLLVDLLARVHAAQRSETIPPRTTSRLLAFAKLPTDYGFQCLCFLLLAYYPAFVVVYTLLTLSTVGYTALVLPRWYGRMRNLT